MERVSSPEGKGEKRESPFRRALDKGGTVIVKGSEEKPY